VSDPKRCSQARALSDALVAKADALNANDPNQSLLYARADTVLGSECAAGVANIVLNNPDLKPEISRSLTFGLVFEPMKKMNVSVDYWNIHRKDEIGVKGSQELLAVESALPAGTKITRDTLANDSTFTAAERTEYGVTVGRLKTITGSFENVAKTMTSGVDLDANGKFDFWFGSLDLGFKTTYMLRYYAYSAARGGYGDNLAGRYGFPRFTASLSVALNSGAFTNGLRVPHSSATVLQTDYYDTDWSTDGCAAKNIAESDCRVRAASRLDYFVSYTGLKNLTVGIYVRNVLNQFPPFDIKSLTNNGGRIQPTEPKDPQGRTLKVSLEYKFF
jgi:iron complex outermembrane recepter protein